MKRELTQKPAGNEIIDSRSLSLPLSEPSFCSHLQKRQSQERANDVARRTLGHGRGHTKQEAYLAASIMVLSKGDAVLFRLVVLLFCRSILSCRSCPPLKAPAPVSPRVLCEARGVEGGAEARARERGRGRGGARRASCRRSTNEREKTK